MIRSCNEPNQRAVFAIPFKNIRREGLTALESRIPDVESIIPFLFFGAVTSNARLLKYRLYIFLKSDRPSRGRRQNFFRRIDFVSP